MNRDHSVIFETASKYCISFGFLDGSVVISLPANAGDTGHAGLIPGSGRFLEEEMATHSSVLAWIIPGMVEPDGLPSMGSHRVGHN